VLLSPGGGPFCSLQRLLLLPGIHARDVRQEPASASCSRARPPAAALTCDGGCRLQLLLLPPHPHPQQYRSGALVCDNSSHEGSVRGLAFAPDGRFLLTCADDKSARVWDVSDWSCVRHL
jgi:WD40 repeat protein